MNLRPMSDKRRAELTGAGLLQLGSTFARSVALRVRRRAVDTGPSADVRALVRKRSEGMCEWPGCIATATDMHHRLNRKIGGRHGAMAALVNGPAWLLHVCRHHHQRVTSPFGPQLMQARGWGWVLTEGQDATQVPVWTAHQYGPVLLTDNGDWELCA